MNKEIQVLYTIFELELNPPFELRDAFGHYYDQDLYSKHSEMIGHYKTKDKYIYVDDTKMRSILTKIKQFFNVDEFADYNVYPIAKHLVNWFQDKLPVVIEKVECYNFHTRRFVQYP